MNSLKFKMLGLMTAIMSMAVGLTVWHNLNTQNAMLSQIADQNGRVLGETIRSSITSNMATGGKTTRANILKGIQKEPAIEAVRIFDEKGRILLSSRSEETGEQVPSSDLIAYRSDILSSSGERRGNRYHTTLVPIHNAPYCYRCHGSSKTVLGILNVRLSLNELQALQREGRKDALFSSIGMLAVLIFTITVFILIYVDAPIRKLVAAMGRVERGEFDIPPIDVRSSKEMSLLSSKFNLMVEHLKDLIDTTVQRERELAISHGKLAYHDEIRNMNITLEERLKEIEYLNITLEERVEEIEEANFKIADLASDLENKNTTLEKAVDRLSALYKIGLAINSTMDLERLFELLLRKTMDTLGARYGYILLLDQEQDSLCIAAMVGGPLQTERPGAIPMRPGGVSYWVIKNHEPLLIRNIDEADDFNKFSPVGFTRQSVVCAPLTSKKEVIGTITVANKIDESVFGSDDLELLSTIAAQASVAIRKAHFYEEQQTTYLNTVQALVSAIEASDAYTRGHSERVTRFSLALARRMELPLEALKRLEQAAILHDIGKIGVDVALLHKEGKLSTEDIDLLQQHPGIGVNILKPIHFLSEVRQIIAQHHERFDGKGYPHGIPGTEILLESRILSVADTYDAMTSDRPYRKALSHETTLREIADHAGSQFDPDVVEAFVRLCREEGLPKE